MVMHVRSGVVIGLFLVLVVLLVSVNQRRMVVLMLMVLGSMCEFAQRAAGVVVRHVIVVVGVNVRRMRVLVFAHYRLVLGHADVLIHGWVPLLISSSSCPSSRPPRGAPC
jgi:hypothetical protein